MIGGIVLNRFRGDPALLEPGLEQLRARTGVPVVGVLPHLGAIPLLGGEDSLDVPAGTVGRARGPDPVRVVAVRLPHLANPSDLDPLLGEPDVMLRWTTDPADVAGADLVVVPGSRATVADLAWLRRTGTADAIQAAHRAGATLLGICAGHQMLGARIVDPVESGAGTVEGLGVLDAETTFHSDKVVARRSGVARVGEASGVAVAGYQIHLGRTTGAGPWLHLDRDRRVEEADGSSTADGRVLGTSLHGVLDADGLRSVLLGAVADRRGRRFAPAPEPFAARLERQHDRLADWLGEHLDMTAVAQLATTAAPPWGGPGWC